MSDNNDTTTTTDHGPLSMDDAVRLVSAPEASTDSIMEQPEDDEEGWGGQMAGSFDPDEGDPEAERSGDDLEGAEHARHEDGDDEEGGAGGIVEHNARVRLADGSFTTVAELVESGLRRDDYTRKTQETAAERHATLAERETLMQLRQANEEVRAYTIAVLEQFMPVPPDEALYATDIVRAMEQERAYRQRLEELDYLKAQRDWDNQEALRYRGEESQALSNAEWAKLLAHPDMTDLRDETRGRALLTGMLAYGQRVGFSEAELRGALAFDHRQAVILKKAMAFDALQDAKKKVIPQKAEGRPPVQRGSRRLNSHGLAHRDATVAMNRLEQSGSIRDGVRALLAMEKTKG